MIDRCRFTVDVDMKENVITVTDAKEKLKTEFDSEILLSPAEDALIVIEELNIQCAIVDMLIEQLKSYEDIQDIEYWIKEVRDECYEN